ncbi:putative cyclin d [Tripterygium wilfordii]|uniref:B-like cyclin n=1 Tax=Tripterygium wilfordii TaxID=458696 RepID=A0A7J7C3D6_TRIWF|nr:putative cyclin-D6-1 [Tripterygium wilfordii]KAF5728633.1 putative cyclin d [Tripterygium wilfordii]
MEFDLENPLTSSSTEQQPETVIPDLFSSESDHLPSLVVSQTSDFHICFRREAISLALRAQYSCDLDPLITYLAVNYIDRFMSKKEIQQGKPWVLNLLVISCLSLAAKIKNTDFSASDFQREQVFIFDRQTINRMELLILNALGWRMRSITPFSFLCFFISLMEPKDPPLKQALKDRASGFIFKAQHEIKLLEFKPSIIAASALILASHELLPMQYSSFKTSILSCQYVNREKLLACSNAMQEMVMGDGYESVSSTRTPLSVLDQHYNKSVTDNSSSTTTITSVGMSMTPGKREIKRRKFNNHFNENKVGFSQRYCSDRDIGPDTLIKQRSE